MAPPQHRMVYTGSSLRNVEHRSEQYDKHGQLISITLSPKCGHKLPMLVKFPRTSSYFRRMENDCIYRNHSEGLFNSTYYIPKKYDQGQLPIQETTSASPYWSPKNVPGVGVFHLKQHIKRTQKYLIVRNAYRDVSKNVYVHSQRKVTMKKKQNLTNFRKDPGMKNMGMSNDTFQFSISVNRLYV